MVLDSSKTAIKQIMFIGIYRCFLALVKLTDNIQFTKVFYSHQVYRVKICCIVSIGGYTDSEKYNCKEYLKVERKPEIRLWNRNRNTCMMVKGFVIQFSIAYSANPVTVCALET